MVKTLSFPDIAFCRILEGVDTIGSTNPLLQSMWEAFSSVAGEMLEICERTGDFRLSNVSLSGIALLGLAPSGDYRIVSRVFDDLDNNVMNGSYSLRLVNGIK